MPALVCLDPFTGDVNMWAWNRKWVKEGITDLGYRHDFLGIKKAKNDGGRVTAVSTTKSSGATKPIPDPTDPPLLPGSFDGQPAIYQYFLSNIWKEGL